MSVQKQNRVFPSKSKLSATCLGSFLQLDNLLVSLTLCSCLFGFVETGSAQQANQSRQDPEAVAALRDVLTTAQGAVQFSAASITFTGEASLWRRKAQVVPFSLQVTGKSSTLTALVPGETVLLQDDGNTVTRALGEKKQARPRRTRDRLWFFPLNEIPSLVERKDLNVIFLGEGASSGKHLAVVAVKQVSLGPLRGKFELEDRDAAYFEIDIDKHEILAISDCNTPVSELPSTYCRMHRFEFADYRVDGGIRVPHKITETTGFAPENVFVVNAVTAVPR